MIKIYLFPGLGADERVFSEYQFAGMNKIVINWISPKKSESLRSYAMRIMEAYEIEDDAILAGVSFGGMVASEIAKVLPESRLYLISSAASYTDIPFLFRLPARMSLINFIPDKLLTTPTWMLHYAFGVRTRTHKILLSSIIRSTSPDYLRWAIGSIGRWKGVMRKDRYYKIHGSNDHLLPDRKNSDHLIDGAGHFMVVQHAKEINDLILTHLTTG